MIPMTSRSRVRTSAAAAVAPLVVSKTSQLAQLAGMTVLSIDTGDLAVIQRFAASGLITDASGYYALRVPPTMHTLGCPPCSALDTHVATQPAMNPMLLCSRMLDAKLLHELLPNPDRDWPRDNHIGTLR